MIPLCIRVATLAAALTLTVVNRHANAQIILFSENFDQFPSGNPALPHNNWVNTVISGDASVDQWVFDNPGGRIYAAPLSGGIAIFDSDWNSQNNQDENVALESPAFSAAGFHKILLRFDQYFDGTFNAGDSILVEIFDGQAWSRVYSYTGSIGILSTEMLDITSSLANTTAAKVRFRFVGNWSYYWMLDNIRVTGYYNFDAAAVDGKFTHNSCGDIEDSIEVEVINLGLISISGVEVKAHVTGSVGGAQINSDHSATYLGTLSPGARGHIRLPGLNTTPGGTLNVRVWTELSNENNFGNDTAPAFSSQFLGIPAALNVSNGSRCGQGSVTLQAHGAGNGDSVFWYNSAQAPAPLSIGENFTTPVAGPGTFDYYVSSGRGVAKKELVTNYSGGGGAWGVMFNVQASRTLVIDSFEVNMDTGIHLVEVYYKTGTYQGYENNPGAWTLLGSTTLNVISRGATIVDVGNMTLPVGSGYAFYIQAPNAAAVNYGQGTLSVSNADLLLEGGVGKGPNFTGTFSPRHFNGALHYTLFPLCEGPRQLAQVFIKPLTTGSALLKGTPFQGQYRSGTVPIPHVVAQGDSLSIDIQAPSGTSNSGFGTDWTITRIEFITLNGSPVNSQDTFTRVPVGNKNAAVFFVPGATAPDSTYRVRVNVNSVQTGCDTVMETVIYVAPRPVSLFTAAGVCHGDTVQFANASTIISGNLTHSWDFGDGTTSGLINPIHAYASPGTYHVILTVVSDYGYASQQSKLILVKPRPNSNFDFTNACEGTPVSLNNTTLLPTGLPAFHWDFGDGNSDTGQHATHYYVSPGSYLVTLTVEVGGCSSNISKVVTQAASAIPAFSASTSCNNKQADFINTSKLSSGTMGYRWDFGDGTFSTTAQPGHSYSGFGDFNVKLKVFTDLGCEDSVTVLINLLQAPTASFSHSNPCVGQAIQFDNTSVKPPNYQDQYFWDFGDGTTSNSEFPSHSYSGEGEFTVTLRSFSSNGCSDSLFRKLMVNEKPNAGVVAAYVLCDGETVEVRNATGSSKPELTKYNWDFGNNLGSTAKDTSFIYEAPGIYKIRLIAAISGGCSDTATHIIRISPLPSADFTVESQYTKDGSFRFTSQETTPGIAYQWFLGDGTKSNLDNPTHRYKYDGIYFVTLITRNGDYCFSEKEDTISVYRTDIKKPLENGLVRLYPNPNQGRFVVEFTEEAIPEELKVINALGQEVPFNRSMLLDGKTTLEVPGAASGAYYVRVAYKNGRVKMIPFVVGD